MKEFIKTLLRESLLGEEYPINWDIEEFKKLNSFKARVDYCNQNLTKIASGSSRIVYKIDDEKVLKLAKNRKGLAQNEVEIEYSNYYDIKDVVANVFDSDDNNLWVEMELARKVSKSIFKNIVGVDFETYCNFLNYNYYTNVKPNSRMSYSKPENIDELYDNEFISVMNDFMVGYNLPVGDLKRLSTYGLVNRYGEDTIVMIDYGLTEDVYSSYYS